MLGDFWSLCPKELLDLWNKVSDNFWEMSLLFQWDKVSADLGKCHFCPRIGILLSLPEWIWGPLTRNLIEVRLRGFLHQGTIFRQNQPKVSKKVVSISWVLTIVEKNPHIIMEK